ncbi:MAG: FxsA family protein [Gammaproteobacteria bacterium]
MRIFPVAFGVFILVPIIEIYLFIKVGSQIGALNTVLLVLITAVIGAALLRKQGLSTMQQVQRELQRGELPQGLSTMQQVQRELQRGELPATSMLQAMLLFIAGALLLTPGFFTDTLGLLLMIPPLRKLVALWLLERSGWIVQLRTQPPRPQSRHDDAHTLEGEYRRRDD